MKLSSPSFPFPSLIFSNFFNGLPFLFVPPLYSVLEESRVYQTYTPFTLMVLESLSPELRTCISKCLLGFCTLCTYYRNLRHTKAKSELITCPTMLLLFLIPSVHRSGIYLVTQTRNWAAPLNSLPLHAVNHQVSHAVPHLLLG